MRERPILFSGSMVRVIGDGSKTQTRRVVKFDSSGYIVERGGKRRWHRDDPAAVAACPYGQPGDRLWVKEGWSDQHPLAIQAGRYSQPGTAGIPGPPPVDYQTIYRADGEPLQIWTSYDGHPYFTLAGPCDEIDAKYPGVTSNYTRGGRAIHWCSSINMPRRASRYTLEIVERRLQRLQDISTAECWAEGIPASLDVDPRHEFIDLWDSINAKRAPWSSNPWVWAVTFRRVEQ